MTLADRLNQIIEEQKLSKREFARRIGVSENYLYILTGNSRRDSDKNKTISPSLAKLIAVDRIHDVDYIGVRRYGQRKQSKSEAALPLGDIAPRHR